MSNTFCIYADESGPIPTRDDAALFLGAAFSIPSFPDVPLPATRSTEADTAQLLGGIEASPICRFVRPFPGYEAKLRAMFESAETMARYSALQQGGLHAVGSLDNYIWYALMTLVAGNAASIGLFRAALNRVRAGQTLSPPQLIRVVFHRKRISPGLRNAMRNATHDVGRITAHVYRGLAQGGSADASEQRVLGELAAGIRNCPVEVTWTHEREFEFNPTTGQYDSDDRNPHAGPLSLADSLAYRLYGYLRNDPETVSAFEARLIRECYGDEVSAGRITRIAADYTDRLVAGHPREAVERWSRATGLPIPSNTPIMNDDEARKITEP